MKKRFYTPKALQNIFQIAIVLFFVFLSFFLYARLASPTIIYISIYAPTLSSEQLQYHFVDPFHKSLSTLPLLRDSYSYTSSHGEQSSLALTFSSFVPNSVAMKWIETKKQEMHPTQNIQIDLVPLVSRKNTPTVIWSTKDSKKEFDQKITELEEKLRFHFPNKEIRPFYPIPKEIQFILSSQSLKSLNLSWSDSLKRIQEIISSLLPQDSLYSREILDNIKTFPFSSISLGEAADIQESPIRESSILIYTKDHPHFENADFIQPQNTSFTKNWNIKLSEIITTDTYSSLQTTELPLPGNQYDDQNIKLKILFLIILFLIIGILGILLLTFSDLFFKNNTKKETNLSLSTGKIPTAKRHGFYKFLYILKQFYVPQQSSIKKSIILFTFLGIFLSISIISIGIFISLSSEKDDKYLFWITVDHPVGTDISKTQQLSEQVFDTINNSSEITTSLFFIGTPPPLDSIGIHRKFLERKYPHQSTLYFSVSKSIDEDTLQEIQTSLHDLSTTNSTRIRSFFPKEENIIPPQKNLILPDDNNILKETLRALYTNPVFKSSIIYSSQEEQKNKTIINFDSQKIKEKSIPLSIAMETKNQILQKYLLYRFTDSQEKKLIPLIIYSDSQWNLIQIASLSNTLYSLSDFIQNESIVSTLAYWQKKGKDILTITLDQKE